MPGDCFFFAGTSLEVVRMDATDLVGAGLAAPHAFPAGAGRAWRCRRIWPTAYATSFAEPESWRRFLTMREWLEMQRLRSILPGPDQLLVETFPRMKGGITWSSTASEGWNAHQSLGMLLTRRMESRGLMPIGFVSNDYARLPSMVLRPIDDPRPLFESRYLDRGVRRMGGSEQPAETRAFRDVAVISGLIERQHPGSARRGGRSPSPPTLSGDACKYEPGHADGSRLGPCARALTDVGGWATDRPRR